jgi:hypothetical protein
MFVRMGIFGIKPDALDALRERYYVSLSCVSLDTLPSGCGPRFGVRSFWTPCTGCRATAQERDERRPSYVARCVRRASLSSVK